MFSGESLSNLNKAKAVSSKVFTAIFRIIEV